MCSKYLFLQYEEKSSELIPYYTLYLIYEIPNYICQIQVESWILEIRLLHKSVIFCSPRGASKY